MLPKLISFVDDFLRFTILTYLTDIAEIGNLKILAQINGINFIAKILNPIIGLRSWNSWKYASSKYLVSSGYMCPQKDILPLLSNIPLCIIIASNNIFIIAHDVTNIAVAHFHGCLRRRIAYKISAKDIRGSVYC